jgi:hypothetical protein
MKARLKRSSSLQTEEINSLPDYENYSIGHASPVVAWPQRPGQDRLRQIANVHGELLVSDQDNYAIVFDCQMICPANLRSIVCASDSGLGDREP